MQILPENITNLIDEFSKLPSIGPKSAERLVFYLLSSGDTEQFGQAMLSHHLNSEFSALIGEL